MTDDGDDDVGARTKRSSWLPTTRPYWLPLRGASSSGFVAADRASSDAAKPEAAIRRRRSATDARARPSDARSPIAASSSGGEKLICGDKAIARPLLST